MGDGRADSQRVWHEYVGKLVADKTILDVGAGIGLSKPRLENGGSNRVTTQDIDRSLMLSVDMVCNLHNMVMGIQKWDVVVAFDVIEHAPMPDTFLRQLVYLAREHVLFTTPSHKLYPHPWHFTAEVVEAMAKRVSQQPRWFARYKQGERDEIMELAEGTFLTDPSIYAFGVMLDVGQQL